jgi:hypothetical protein
LWILFVFFGTFRYNLIMIYRLILAIVLISYSTEELFCQDSILVFNSIDSSVIKFPFPTVVFDNNPDVKDLEITKYSYCLDSLELIPKDFQDECCTDKQFLFINSIGLNQIKGLKDDSLLGLFKCFFVDTVLSYRYASIGFPFKAINADSLFGVIKEDLDRGIKWNELRHHFTVCEVQFDPAKDYKGDRGWSITEGNSEFVNALLNHKLYGVFLFKSDVVNWAYIIYKTHKEKYIVRKKMKTLSLPLRSLD